MSSQLAIAQQPDLLSAIIAAAGPLPAARSTLDTASPDTPSEFAQLIQSLSPPPVDAKTVPGTGNTLPPPVSRGTAQKIANIAPQPVSPETAQKIANIAPQPVSPETAQKIANIAPQPVSQETAQKIANIAPQPVSRETAQKIASIAPQPINSGTGARAAVKTMPVEQTAKNANAGAPPPAATPAAPGETQLGPEGAPTYPGQAAPVVDEPIETAEIPEANSRATQNTADVSSALETNTPMPAPKQETAEAAAPTENQPMRKPAPAKSNESALPPAIAVAIPVLPLPLPPVATRTAASNAPPPQQSIEAPPQEPFSAPVLAGAPALEVRIRATEQPKDNSAQVTQAQPQPQAQPQLQPEIPVLARTVSSPNQVEPQVQVQPQSNPVAAVAQSQAAPVMAPAASRMERPASQPAQFYEAAAEPPGRSQTQAQPLRSVSLEFTPDGAADVRLRLSERAGDVHIELHSTDSALTGRLSEGVHDLAASLVNAGYDAQAWTPGQDREGAHPQPQEEEQSGRRDQSADPDAEDFDTAMQEPMKEFS